MIDLSLNAPKAIQSIINFLQTYIAQTPFKKVVIGLSGGIDSSLSALLVAKAIGSKNLIVALLPFGDLSKNGLTRAKKMLSVLNVPKENIIEQNITAIANSIFSLDTNLDNIRRGNIMARLRMLLLYDIAKKHDALVCGTENKTEYVLGYFTRFGDEASDIEPIRHLYKKQIRQLATYLNMPKEIQEAPPSAELWENQTDEGEFGFSYEEADSILYLYMDQKHTKEDIIKNGFNKDVVEKVMKRVEDNKYKHELPYALEI